MPSLWKATWYGLMPLSMSATIVGFGMGFAGGADATGSSVPPVQPARATRRKTASARRPRLALPAVMMGSNARGYYMSPLVRHSPGKVSQERLYRAHSSPTPWRAVLSG